MSFQSFWCSYLAYVDGCSVLTVPWHGRSERKPNEERYYSDSFIKNVIVIKGSSFMCSIFSHGSKVYVRRSIKTNNSRKMEPWISRLHKSFIISVLCTVVLECVFLYILFERVLSTTTVMMTSTSNVSLSGRVTFWAFRTCNFIMVFCHPILVL